MNEKMEKNRMIMPSVGVSATWQALQIMAMAIAGMMSLICLRNANKKRCCFQSTLDSEEPYQNHMSAVKT